MFRPVYILNILADPHACRVKVQSAHLDLKMQRKILEKKSWGTGSIIKKQMLCIEQSFLCMRWLNLKFKLEENFNDLIKCNKHTKLDYFQ